MRTKTTPLSVTLALALLAAAGPAPAVQPAELVGPDLQRRSIRFVGLSGGTLQFFDADRRLRKAEAAGFVSLRLQQKKEQGAGSPATEAAGPGGNGKQTEGHLLRLADGQRLRGQFAGVEDGKLRWQTGRLGELKVGLDRIHRVVLSDADKTPDLSALEAAAGNTGDDAVLLANGDTLTGFVEAAQADGLRVAIEGQSLTLAWDRVAALRLPNPIQYEPGVWLRLRNGSRIRVDEAALDSEAFTGKAFGGRSIEVPTGEIAAVDFYERHRLVPLGRLSPDTVSGGHVFGVPTPPELDETRARLHAPLELRFELPERARRFAADAMLAPDGLGWADLELIVRDGEGQRFSERLNADRPEARINVGLRDRTLAIRLDEGANGPIRDRLRLENAVLLVETKPQTAD